MQFVDTADNFALCHIVIQILYSISFIFSSRCDGRSTGFVLDSCQFWTAVSIKYRGLEFISFRFQWQCALACMSTLHQEIQVPHFTVQTPEVWMREGAIISLSPLLLYGKAESTYAATHTTYSWLKHISKIVLWILLYRRDLNESYDHLAVSFLFFWINSIPNIIILFLF